ncbi:hypothetical protein ACFV30_33740 [Streptomyces sp. NPDC059752]|uniref:hypothetical protein n=1 Tax=unclassified Streptomyces TaxID=2593676 RepID=UPI003657823A
MYRIGVPLWQTAAGGGVEPAEYSTGGTAEQLRPLPGVDLVAIPAHPRTRTSVPTRWARLLDGRTHGRPATAVGGAERRPPSGAPGPRRGDGRRRRDGAGGREAGAWVSTTKSRRDKLTADQLAALAKLDVDWA